MKSPNGYMFHSRYEKNSAIYDIFIRSFAYEMHAALTELTQLCIANSKAENESELHPTVQKAIHAISKANGWDIE